MGLVADVDRIAPQQAEKLGERVGVAVGDVGGDDGGRADEPFTVEPGEEFFGAGEEGGEAEGEVIWGVSWLGEGVARDLELAVANRDEYALLV